MKPTVKQKPTSQAAKKMSAAHTTLIKNTMGNITPRMRVGGSHKWNYNKGV